MGQTDRRTDTVSLHRPRRMRAVSTSRYIIIIIIIKGMYIAQVRKGHKCAMSAEMAVCLRNCLCLYSYLHNEIIKTVKQKCLHSLMVSRTCCVLSVAFGGAKTAGVQVGFG